MSTKSIKGTRTEQCVLTAYLSECDAYARYTYYAQQADKESYFPIGIIFNDTAANELHHAKVYFKMLEGGKLTVPVTTDAGVIADTASNLRTAVSEETTENLDYVKFAAIAREEGFDEIASHFEAIATVEARHKARFAKYLEMVENGTLWKRDTPVKWRCLVCGYEIVATEPPQKCPGCDHPYQHYIALGDADI